MTLHFGSNHSTTYFSTDPLNLPNLLTTATATTTSSSNIIIKASLPQSKTITQSGSATRSISSADTSVTFQTPFPPSGSFPIVTATSSDAIALSVKSYSKSSFVVTSSNAILSTPAPILGDRTSAYGAGNISSCSSKTLTAVVYSRATDRMLMYAQLSTAAAAFFTPACAVGTTPEACGTNHTVQIVNGLPVIVYLRLSDNAIMCVRAIYTSSSIPTFSPPQRIGTDTATSVSFTIGNGYPIVCYSSMNNPLLLFFATTSDGTDTFVTTAINHAGRTPIIRMSNGTPIIIYNFNSDLCYIQTLPNSSRTSPSFSKPVKIGVLSTTPALMEIVNGNPWILAIPDATSTPLLVKVTVGNNPSFTMTEALLLDTVGSPSFQVNSGVAAIAYARASDNGLIYSEYPFSSPQLVNPNACSSPSLFFVNGVPSVAYSCGSDGSVYCNRATSNASPVYISSFSPSTTMYTGLDKSNGFALQLSSTGTTAVYLRRPDNMLVYSGTERPQRQLSCNTALFGIRPAVKMYSSGISYVVYTDPATGLLMYTSSERPQIRYWYGSAMPAIASAPVIAIPGSGYGVNPSIQIFKDSTLGMTYTRTNDGALMYSESLTVIVRGSSLFGPPVVVADAISGASNPQLISINNSPCIIYTSQSDGYIRVVSFQGGNFTTQIANTDPSTPAYNISVLKTSDVTGGAATFIIVYQALAGLYYGKIMYVLATKQAGANGFVFSTCNPFGTAEGVDPVVAMTRNVNTGEPTSFIVAYQDVYHTIQYIQQLLPQGNFTDPIALPNNLPTNLPLPFSPNGLHPSISCFYVTALISFIRADGSTILYNVGRIRGDGVVTFCPNLCILSNLSPSIIAAPTMALYGDGLEDPSPPAFGIMSLCYTRASDNAIMFAYTLVDKYRPYIGNISNTVVIINPLWYVREQPQLATRDSLLVGSCPSTALTADQPSLVYTQDMGSVITYVPKIGASLPMFSPGRGITPMLSTVGSAPIIVYSRQSDNAIMYVRVTPFQAAIFVTTVLAGCYGYHPQIQFIGGKPIVFYLRKSDSAIVTVYAADIYSQFTTDRATGLFATDFSVQSSNGSTAIAYVNLQDSMIAYATTGDITNGATFANSQTLSSVGGASPSLSIDVTAGVITYALSYIQNADSKLVYCSNCGGRTLTTTSLTVSNAKVYFNNFSPLVAYVRKVDGVLAYNTVTTTTQNYSFTSQATRLLNGVISQGITPSLEVVGGLPIIAYTVQGLLSCLQAISLTATGAVLFTQLQLTTSIQAVNPTIKTINNLPLIVYFDGVGLSYVQGFLSNGSLALTTPSVIVGTVGDNTSVISIEAIGALPCIFYTHNSNIMYVLTGSSAVQSFKTNAKAPCLRKVNSLPAVVYVDNGNKICYVQTKSVTDSTISFTDVQVVSAATAKTASTPMMEVVGGLPCIVYIQDGVVMYVTSKAASYIGQPPIFGVAIRLSSDADGKNCSSPSLKLIGGVMVVSYIGASTTVMCLNVTTTFLASALTVPMAVTPGSIGVGLSNLQAVSTVAGGLLKPVLCYSDLRGDLKFAIFDAPATISYVATSTR